MTIGGIAFVALTEARLDVVLAVMIVGLTVVVDRRAVVGEVDSVAAKVALPGDGASGVAQVVGHLHARMLLFGTIGIAGLTVDRLLIPALLLNLRVIRPVEAAVAGRPDQRLETRNALKMPKLKRLSSKTKTCSC